VWRNAVIYKICSDALWRELQITGQTLGSFDDERDGFIHFSTALQLLGTFEKYFRSEFESGSELWLLSVDPESLEPNSLRYEASSRDNYFPHLYAPLNLAQVLSARKILTVNDLIHLA